MSIASMQHAFANAAPADTPHIDMVTRTITGLRVYFNNTTLDRRRFNYTLEGTTLLLDEVPADGRHPAGQVVRARGVRGEWQCEALRGAQLRMVNLKIEPSWAAGKLAYVVPDIEGLAFNRERYHHYLRRQRELEKLRQAEREQFRPAAAPIPETPLPPPPPPTPGPVPRLGPPGSTSGEIVAMDEYMKGVLRVITQLEKISYHRLVKARKENGDSYWAWRAPDIRLDEE